LLESLQPGAGAKTVRDALSGVGLRSSRELEQLYGWHNGTCGDGVPLGDIWMFPTGMYMMSLDEVVADYRTFVGDAQWQRCWLPLFADGGGGFYVLDYGSGTEQRVRLYWNEEEEHLVVFDSIKSMLATFAAAFDRGLIDVHPDGYLDMDLLLLDDLRVAMNPHADVRPN
jgi:cell wall assembly regulator SMI1